MRPKYRFCWHCGNKLQGNHYTTRIVNGNEVILHKACGKELDEEKVLTIQII